MTSYTTAQNDARLRNSAADLRDVGLPTLSGHLVDLANAYDTVAESVWRDKAMAVSDLLVAAGLLVEDRATMLALMKAFAAIKAA